jgi:hypothetical protein
MQRADLQQAVRFVAPAAMNLRGPLPMNRRFKHLRSLLLLGALVAVAGCKNVEPWQRKTLSDATMRGDRDPAGLGLSEHMWFSREAASGGRGVGGGGCGCN